MQSSPIETTKPKITQKQQVLEGVFIFIDTCSFCFIMAVCFISALLTWSLTTILVLAMPFIVFSPAFLPTMQVAIVAFKRQESMSRQVVVMGSGLMLVIMVVRVSTIFITWFFGMIVIIAFVIASPKLAGKRKEKR